MYVCNVFVCGVNLEMLVDSGATNKIIYEILHDHKDFL